MGVQVLGARVRIPEQKQQQNPQGVRVGHFQARRLQQQRQQGLRGR